MSYARDACAYVYPPLLYTIYYMIWYTGQLRMGQTNQTLEKTTEKQRFSWPYWHCFSLAKQSCKMQWSFMEICPLKLWINATKKNEGFLSFITVNIWIYERCFYWKNTSLSPRSSGGILTLEQEKTPQIMRIRYLNCGFIDTVSMGKRSCNMPFIGVIARGNEISWNTHSFYEKHNYKKRRPSSAT